MKHAINHKRIAEGVLADADKRAKATANPSPNPLAGTVYTAPDVPERCPTCMQKVRTECGRIECGRRERLTADEPVGLVAGRVVPRFF